jgi:predicted DNA-binding transcriptional regulator YafY
MRGILLRAIENQTLIEMIYLTKDGSISQRIIRVKEMNQDKINAYCYLRKSNRNFTISNILSLSPIQNRNRSAS